MAETRTISEVMTELKNKSNNSAKLVRNWKEMIPPGSKWFPGCPGDPACKECDGIGYLRIDGLRVDHPFFGKLFFCDCTAGRVTPTKPKYEAEQLRSMPAYLE